uniref:Replication-associated protein ORF2/G2P domain-containing protein n=1 Tax=uncultured prokaryote TaxID=198431 RepID=A0A0H5Q378_9ZZZZ|nr:hypothetical protein [uncultured prokaryote]
MVVDRLTGQFWDADCDSGVCSTCGINRARVRARLITERSRAFEHPRFLTFTKAPEDWQQRRCKVRDLARRLRSDGYRTEWIWVTERGSKTGMVHVHAIQTGDYIPQAYLQKRWGDFRVDIRSAKPKHGEYISKSAGRIAGYVGKTAGMDLDAALSLNGGRLHHWSRGFFGMPIREYRKSLSEALPRECVLQFNPDARSEKRAQYTANTSR